MAKVIVTGAAGFIGYHLCQRLLARGDEVVGVDNVNDYYSTQLKRDRLAQLADHATFHFVESDLADRARTARFFAEHPVEIVLHMAAQAGVRYALENPHAYVDSNLVALVNVLESCRGLPLTHFLYASSSSVYGANKKVPFSVADRVDHPISLYAATKRAGELLVETYSHLHGLPATGLRFFTVYGPWGRPDMAIYRFTDAMLSSRPILLFNHGRMWRDFTYIDDVIEAVVRVARRPPTWDRQDANAPVDTDHRPSNHGVYNIGSHQPISLERLILLLEEILGVRAERELLPLQPGDLLETYADVAPLAHDFGFQPSTPIELGLRQFVQWYRAYHKR